MEKYSVYFCGQHTSPMQLSDAAQNIYRKELIYVGDFTKKLKDGTEQPFTITAAWLTHAHNTFAKMSANGVEVPVPAEHTTNPDKKRGKLIRTELGKNEKGLDAIFGYIQFNDETTATQNKNNNVSIFVPVSMTDGKNNTYESPIAHVALTDYPVIPGLGKFELVASFTPSPGIQKMDKLAELLGVDPKAENLEAALETAIKALLDKAKGGDKPPAPPTPPGGASNPPSPTPSLALSAPVAKTMATLVSTNRQAAINSRIGTKLTPASAAVLQKQFCDLPALELSLTSTGQSNDVEFANALAVLDANANVLKLGEKSGAQLPPGLTLSNDQLTDSKHNSLLANAERRAAAAAGK